MTVSDRIKKMLSVHIFGTSVTVIERYATIPLLGYFWGFEMLASWLLIQIIPTYMNMADCGLPSAVGNAMLKHKKNGRDQLASDLYHCMRRIVLYISCLAFMIIAYYGIGDFRSIFNISNISMSDFYWIILLSVFYTLMILQTQVLQAKFKAVTNHVYHNKIVQISRLLEFAALAVCVASGLGMVAVILAQILVRVIFNSYLSVISRNYLVKPENSDLKQIIPFIGPSLGFMGIPLLQAVNVQGFAWLIAFCISPVASGIFTVYRTYSRAIFQVGELVRRVIWHELSILSNAPQDLSHFKEIIKQAMIYIAMITIPMVVILSFCGQWLIPAWTGGEVSSNAPTITMLLLCACLGAFKSIYLAAFTSINKHSMVIAIDLAVNIISLVYLLSQEMINMYIVSETLLLINVITLAIYARHMRSVKKFMTRIHR